jgi:hypothetical protein
MNYENTLLIEWRYFDFFIANQIFHLIATILYYWFIYLWGVQYLKDFVISIWVHAMFWLYERDTTKQSKIFTYIFLRTFNSIDTRSVVS